MASLLVSCPYATYITTRAIAYFMDRPSLGLVGSYIAKSIFTTHIYIPLHISSDLALLGFWCALGIYKRKFSKNRVFTESGIFPTAIVYFGIFLSHVFIVATRIWII